MIYLCFKPLNWNHIFEVEKFNTEKEVLKFIEEKHLPPSKIVGIFSGQRLALKLGEKRIVKKGIVGFEDYKEEEKE